MAELIGKVENLEGTFFAKDEVGNIRELQIGDEVYENEIIIPDTNNSTNEKITIALTDLSSSLVINSAQEQLLDTTLLNEDLNNNELAFNADAVENALVLNNQNDESNENDLRSRQFGGEDSNYNEESEENIGEFATLDGSSTDVNSDLRQSSWTDTRDEINEDSSFAQRDGLSTDIVSDLRKAEWYSATEYEEYDGSDTETREETSKDALTSTPDIPKTIIKVVAADASGEPITDANGNYIEVNETPEGGDVYYVALAFSPGTTVFNDNTEEETQEGTVDFIFTNGTAQSSEYKAPTSLTSISLGTAFTTGTAEDDNIADSGEIFTVTISNYTSITTPTVDYGTTTIDNTGVTTTITDNTGDNSIETDLEDTIVKLIALDGNGDAILDGNGDYTFVNDVAEGEVSKYKALAFDSTETAFNSTTQLSDQLGSVRVSSSDNSTQVSGTDATAGDDYTSIATTTVALNTIFSVSTLDDYIADDSETYDVNIDSYVEPTSGDKYENVSASGSVTTTINDNTNAIIEADTEMISIVLVAVDSSTTTISNITDTDGTLIINNTNMTSEGGEFYYIAVAVDSDGKPVSTQDGTVDLSYGITSDSTDSDALADGTEYVNTKTTTTIGEVFSVDALDDLVPEFNENFTVTISNPTSTSYESPVVDTTKDMVTSTIDASVYVQIIHNDEQIEGNDLTHTVQLVNSNGDLISINIPSGETLTATLTYSNDGTDSTDYSTTHTQNGTFTVEFTGTTNSVTVTNTTLDDFISDDSEGYTLTITGFTQLGTSYQTVGIDSKDSVTGTILDGVTLGTPDNASVDEDGLNDGTEVYTDTQSLGIIENNDTYTVAFDTFMPVTDKESGGSEITYTYSDNNKLLTATTVDGTEVFTVQINEDDTYTFKLLEPMTHADGNGENSFDMLFNFTVTSNGTTSEAQTFNVNVTDSVPTASPDVEVKTDEDTSVTITLSDDNFANGEVNIDNGDGNGSQTYALNATITVYDPNDSSVVAGTLTNNGDGTLTFEPTADYSNYDATPTFNYGVTDLDGDTGGGTVSITINPVADAPVVTVSDVTDGLEDADSGQTTGNTNEGTNSIALALTLPTLSTDQTDSNTSVTGDNPERLGYIEFTFTNGADINGAVVEKEDGTDLFTITNDDQVQQIVITTNDGTAVDYTYHNTSIVLGESGVTYLTATEYVELQIIHAEDNDTDIDISISTTSYEVDDGEKPITGLDGATTSKDMTVLINPATDDISLSWDTATNGEISNVDNTSTSGNNNASNTFTFDPVNEGDYYRAPIDLAAILTNTSGTTNVDGDLDGSEERTYIITGIPNGTVINLGGTTVKAKGGTDDNNDATVTVTFSKASNQEEDPTFTMTLPEYYSGSISNATITLSTQDKGAENTDTASSIKTAEVYFNIVVNAVAGEATIQIGQIVGDEDVGRSHGNLLANDYDIDEPENGIELDINVTSDDKDGSEDYIVSIDDIPAGSSLYVYDNSLSDYVLVDSSYSNNGYIAVSEGKTSGTWKITITDYQNDKLPKFIPPHNSDDDYTLKVNAQTIDDASTWNGNWDIVTDKDMTVTVNEVADIPINTELNGYDVHGNVGSDYNLILDESTLDSGTNSFSLSDVYKTPTELQSYDSDSETLSIILSGLEDGFSVEGASYIGGGVWTFLADDIANIKITTPEHFSGESAFNIKYVTTENAGDSKTHFTDEVKIYVTPSSDDVATSNTTIYEDNDYVDEDGVNSTNKIDLSATFTDTDGSESITAVKILVSSVGDGFALYSDASFTNALTDGDGDGYYDLTYDQAQSVYAKNTTEHTADNSKNFDLTVVYTVQDTAADVADNTITSETTTEDFTHTISVIVDAVTDAANIAINTVDASDTNVTVDITSGTKVIVAADGTSFTIPITTTSSDTDSTENVTQILISGVPQGVTIDNGTYQGYIGSVSNGVWLIDGANLDQTILDSDGANQNITFTVNAGADFTNRDISITTYTKDNDASSKELSTSTTFNLEKNYTTVGTEPVDPPLFELGTQEAVIYEDNNGANTYNLGDSLTVTNIGGQLSGGYAVTISGFAEGTELSGYSYTYVENNVTYYVVSGTGSASDVESKLSSVTVTPPADKNDSSESTSSMVFTANIATYEGGTFKDGNTVNYAESINPVTDEMTITIDASDTSEDTETTVSITLDNDVDSSTTIVGDAMYIKVNEDFESGETGTGTFSYGGNELSLVTNPNGLTGDYYVVNITDYILGDTLDFAYTPGENRHGDVTFDVVVYNQENETWTSYDTGVQTSTNSATMTVNAAVDGLESSILDATGTEAAHGDENKIELDMTAVLLDPSESLGSVTFDKIPNGFLIYYGTDANNLSLASNIGQSATYTGTYDISPYGNNEEVTYNKWLIPLDSDGTLPNSVYIQAPDNWSGTLEDIVLNLSDITDGSQSSDVSYTFNATFGANADGITIAPTLTFGDAFSWIDLKINANIEDVDGSETMSATLIGLDDSSQFRLSDGTLFDGLAGNPSATYDNGTWTLEGVSYDQINNIQFTNDNSVSSVEVTVNTVEQSNGNVGESSSTETFTVNITDVSGTLTLEEGINLDFSKLDDTSAFNNVSEIDLSVTGENKIENLSLEDLLSTTDNVSELTINGTADDSVSLDGNWIVGTSDGAQTEYTNSDDSSVSLKIDDNISVTIA